LCVSDIYSPLKEDETIDETVVNIMYPMEDDAKPPVTTLSHLISLNPHSRSSGSLLVGFTTI
jgi:hypothetical protein